MSIESSISKPCFGLLQGRCGSIPTNTTETVMVNDTCPECDADHIDLQVETSAELTTASA